MTGRPLQRRLQRLEAKVRTRELIPPNIFLHFTDSKPDRVRRGECDGRSWVRQPEEGPEGFKDRITNDLKSESRKPPFLVYLFDDVLL